MELVELGSEEDIYKYTAEKIQIITNNSFILVNSYDQQTGSIRIRSYAGISQLITKGLKILGKDLTDMSFPSYKNFDLLKTGRLEKLNDNIHNLTAKKVSAKVSEKLEKLINIQDSFTIGLTRGGELFGNVLILTRKGYSDFDLQLVETFVKQVSITLNRSIAEQALKESEELFRRAFTTIPDPFSISDINTGEFVLVNQGFLNASGYDENEIIGKTSHELKIWQDISERATLLDKLKREGSVKNFHVRLKLKNGEVKPGLLSANIIYLKGIPHLLAIIHDITEILDARKTQSVIYKINEEAIRSKTLKDLSIKIQKELNTLMDSENFFIALYDHNSDKYSFPYHTDNFDRVDENELISLQDSLTDYVRRTGRAALITRAEEKRLMENGDVGLVGKPAPVWMGAPLINSNTGSVFGVVAVQSYKNEEAYNQDDLKLLEYVAGQIGALIGKKKAEELLIDSEQKLRNFVELNPVGIYCFSLAEPIDISVPVEKQIDLFFDAVCSDCNDSYCEMLGVTREQIIGLSVKDIMPRDTTNIEYFRSLIENNYRLSSGISHEYNQKGEEKFFSNSIVGTIINGQLIEAWGTQFDMTERVKVEQDLLQAKKSAEESDRLKTAFLANMSHEIRTPMNAILGFSELLSAPDLSQSDRQKYISLITQNGDNLLQLIDDIIDIAKMEAGEIRISKTDCYIKDIFDELIIVFDEISKKMDKHHIELKIDKTNKDHYVAIYSDPFRIKQVMINLISNALKYTETGWVAFGCNITDYGDIRFFVKDTGNGIPEEKQDVIFERFRQIDEGFTRSSGGTGLGLSISKRMVELLGGSIGLESEVGKGSTFYFIIPFQEADAIASVDEKASEGSIFDWKDKKILVAEDIDSNYELVADILSSTGIEIIRAIDGIDAVHLFQKNRDVNLVLMDIRMPKMDGFKATQLIKAIDRDIPVIAVTAYAMVEEYEQSYEAGCDDHITKPIKIPLFLLKLNKFLN